MGSMCVLNSKASCSCFKNCEARVLCKKLWKIFRAIISRCIFIAFCVMVVWRVTIAWNNSSYWYLLFTLVPLIIETLYSVKTQHHNQLKWVTPYVLFYLFCTIPCFWLLELKNLEESLKGAEMRQKMALEINEINQLLQRQDNSLLPEDMRIDCNYMMEYCEVGSGSNSFTTSSSNVENGRRSVQYGSGNNQNGPDNFIYSLGGIPGTDIPNRFPTKTKNRSLNSLVGNLINISSTVSRGAEYFLEFDTTDIEWNLILQQILIFTLVLAKWIAPKGGVSLSELSQLLLVNIAAGADILELRETETSHSSLTWKQQQQIVFMVSSVWSWSLLQFVFVLTASRDLPQLENTTEELLTTAVIGRSNNSDEANEKTLQTTSLSTENIAFEDHGEKVAHKEEKDKTKSTIVTIKEDSEEKDPSMALDTEKCLDCFCCYNEIWGMVMSIVFQDGPFLIVRVMIIFYYKIVSSLNIFFLGKNFFVIVLIINRIRVIIKEEKKVWIDHKQKVQKQRRLKKEQANNQKAFLCHQRGDPPKSGNSVFRKPRWATWRV